jgi:hypothetical protein
MHAYTTHTQQVTYVTASTVRINHLCAYDMYYTRVYHMARLNVQRPYDIVIDAYTLDYHISVLDKIQRDLHH